MGVAPPRRAIASLVLIPLRVDRPLRRPTRVTYGLIALNLLVFACQQVGPSAIPAAPWWSALALARGDADPWSWLTYAFLHAGIWHLVGNMLILWVFGPAIEDRFGRLRFLAFYLAGAALAGLAHVATSPAGVIGASGAVAAVTGAFLVLFPRSRVRSVMVFFMMGVVLVPAWFLIGLAIARDLFGVGLAPGGMIAHEAHLGGYAFGAGLSLILLATGLIPREPYDLFTAMRQAKRRADIRAAAGRAVEARAARMATDNADSALMDEAANMRAAVTRALAEHRGDDAVAAYRELVARFAASRPGIATLNRRAQMEIGSELYRRAEHALADFAFSRYIDAFPKEADVSEVRVLLARIKSRHRGEPEAAAAMLEHAIAGLREGDVRAAAVAELAQLRAASARGIA